MKKKLINCLLALLLVLCVIPMHADAADITWEVNDDGTLIISGNGEITKEPWKKVASDIRKVEIGDGVTAIGSFVFNSYNNLITVDIGDGVTKIGTGAFRECKNLKNISFGKNIKDIDNQAFGNCDSLVSVELTYGLETVDCFANCDNLQSISFPSTVKYISLYYCNSLNNLTIPKGVKSVAFEKCGGLTTLSLPEGVEHVELKNCLGISNIDLPNSVTYVDLSGCTNLSAISLPNGVTSAYLSECNKLKSILFPDSLKYFKLSKCTGLTSVEIPESVTSIGEYAFQGCANLSSISIPSSVTFVANGAFAGCEKLAYVNISDIAAWCMIDYDSRYGSPSLLQYGAKLYLNGKLLTDCVVPEGVTQISDYAFCDYEDLTSISLPGSVTSIGNQAFWDCKNLTDVTMPNSLVSIGKNAFYNCTNLTNVTMPLELTSVGEHAFEKCTSLTSITIPNSVETIGACAFRGCTKLQTVNMGTGVTTIDTGAFFGCEKLAKIILPDGIKRIEDNTFYECRSLASITIPASVTYIGVKTFYNCNKLKKVCFLGDKPYFDSYAPGNHFDNYWATNMRATCYYPKGNTTWKNLDSDSDTRLLVWYACDHAFSGGSCTRLETCMECGATGSYAHKYREATCTTPKTCTVCNSISGSPLGHKETIVASKPATCIGTGLTSGKKCANCDMIMVEQEVIPKLAHQWKNGYCTYCNQKQTRIVTRLSGASRYETSFAIANEMKKVLGINKFDTIILASSDNFADALAGSYLAAQKQAPILIGKLKYTSMVCAYVNNNLATDGTVYVLGGEGAVPKAMLDGIAVTDNIVRLAGAERYDTNLAILKEAGIGSNDLLVATGRDFADSLSASATGLPILLVNGKAGKSLSADQKAFLRTVKGKIYIIGGDSAVPEALKAEIENASGKRATRIAGGSRYETSVKIAQQFFSSAGTAVVAFAGDFPDGLCGGPLAYVLDAPLLLTKNGKTEAPGYTAKNSIVSGYVLGGTGLISDAFAAEIFAY